MTRRAGASTLWLFRHAKSDWSDTTLRDFDRPLAARGVRDAARMGEWLEAGKARVEVICCSPAVRARATMAGAMDRWKPSAAEIRYDGCLYGATARRLLQLLRTFDASVQALMLVGHNPGLDDLLRALVDDELPLTASGKLMTTSNLAEIELQTVWRDLARGAGRLRRLVRPKALPPPAR